jgi:hypothetical protein
VEIKQDVFIALASCHPMDHPTIIITLGDSFPVQSCFIDSWIYSQTEHKKMGARSARVRSAAETLCQLNNLFLL